MSRDPNSVRFDAATAIEELTDALYNDRSIDLDTFEEYRSLPNELREPVTRETIGVPSPGTSVRLKHAPRWMDSGVVSEVTGDRSDDHYVDGRTVVEYWSQEHSVGVDPSEPVVKVQPRNGGKELSYPVSKVEWDE